MEEENWRTYRHPYPPSEDFDYETTVAKNHLKTAFGDLTQFLVTDDVFYYSSGTSNFSESSDSDSDEEVKRRKSSTIAEQFVHVSLSDEEDSEDSYEECNPVKEGDRKEDGEKKSGVYQCSNKKKISGGEELASKLQILCPGAAPYLNQLIENIELTIVGLDYLCETQTEEGFFYQCHICGISSTDSDIVNHLTSTKHKIKYLEKLHYNGKTNSIHIINSLFGASDKESLIEEECEEILRKYPPQRGVQVFKAKGLLPHGSHY